MLVLSPCPGYNTHDYKARLFPDGVYKSVRPYYSFLLKENKNKCIPMPHASGSANPQSGTALSGIIVYTWASKGKKKEEKEEEV